MINTVFDCRVQLSKLMRQPKSDSREYLISMVEDQIELIKTLEKLNSIQSEITKIMNDK